MKIELLENIVAVVAGLLLAFACNSLAAAHHQKQQVVATPFAIPVGVPVAPYAPFSYASSQAQQQKFTAPPPSKEEEFARQVAPYIIAELQKQNSTFQPLEKATLFAKSCGSCHAKGDSEIGKPQLNLDALTPEQRLKSIDAIVNDRMPKGGKLSAAEAGALIRELTVSKPKARADVPRPPPEGESP